MRKFVTCAVAAAALCGAVALTGCTFGHTADTIVDESSSEAEVTPETTDVPESSVEPTAETTPTPEPTPTEPIPDGMAKSFLTGEYVDEEVGEKRPIEFMIDNSKDAIPQSGISQADIIYESPVETGITRLCAVFEDTTGIDRIGPLRSCRDYFISLTAGLDGIYTHYGQAAYALTYLESPYVDNLSGLLSSTSNCFYRDYTFHQDFHTAYIGDSGIQQAIEIRDYDKTHDEDYDGQFKFAWVGDKVTNEDGEDAKYLATGYVYNTPYFVYNEEDGLYYRYQFDQPHVDAENGEQLAFTNIILEYQNYDIYERLTNDHPIYLHFDTTAGGKGKYITNGKAVDITWERPDFYSEVTYYDADGNELEINTGKTMVCVIQNEKLGECVIGNSAEDAHCVVNDEDLAEAVELNQLFMGQWEYIEPELLDVLTKERNQYIEARGYSKVEEGVYTID